MTHPGHGRAEKDRGNVMMAVAAVSFLALGTLQLWVAERFGRFALTVDGIHNLGDAAILELLRRSRQRPATKVGLWACRIRPAVPLVSCLMAPLSAAVLQVYVGIKGGVSSTESGAWLALALEGISLTANVVFARLLPDLHDHGDHADHDGNTHVLAAKFHLLGDASAAAAAMLGYAAILLGGPPRWSDIIGGWTGAILIAVFHWKPARRSWRNMQQHRIPGHTHPERR